MFFRAGYAKYVISVVSQAGCHLEAVMYPPAGILGSFTVSACFLVLSMGRWGTRHSAYKYWCCQLGWSSGRSLGSGVSSHVRTSHRDRNRIKPRFAYLRETLTSSQSYLCICRIGSCAYCVYLAYLARDEHSNRLQNGEFQEGILVFKSGDVVVRY